MTKKKSLGILICGHIPEEMQDKYGDYKRSFERLLGEDSFDYSGYYVLENEFPDSVDTCDAWLLTGSRHGVYEDHDWIPPLEKFVVEAYNKNIPMVGICFGHQLLAQALGGKVEKFEGGWSAGRVEYALDERFGAPVAALHAFHQDQVVELPPQATSLGSTEFCQYAAIAYGDKALSLQPHPEFDDEFLSDLLHYRANVLPEPI
ncbi:MAG: type 1 glutamine amidotransferase, partial [Gammaproteobacteria bacterium]|nr:type 1 glutamine amidotransferase [Gammaproteobacteria bacterium]